MDFRRAQEIVNSPDHIIVLHQGKPIWIAGLNPQYQTAEVQEKPHVSGTTREVAVDELIEQGSVR